ncbi:MAG: hypothetical protein GY793_09075 [Proteobacteria bacterium]|nr:hypothetical protein [Pseudomonadota bacterium]
MNKTIYIVIYADYEDWDIKGYFEDLEKAEKYVVWWNSTHKYEDLFIQPHELLTPEMDYNSIIVHRHHIVSFHKKGNSWSIRDEPDEYDIYTGEKKKTIAGVCKYNKDIYLVEVTTESRSKAEKIAQDLLNEYLAKNEGI